MQFIEKNSFNVRSAIYRLQKDGQSLEFILFPMIHIGSREFYNDVSDRLAKCDLILAEGVDSRKVNLLTRSYRIVKRIRRMDLVTQQEGMNVAILGGVSESFLIVLVVVAPIFFAIIFALLQKRSVKNSPELPLQN